MVSIPGTSADEQLNGTNGDDSFRDTRGADRIYGLAGNDDIYVDGQDVAYGGDGDDFIQELYPFGTTLTAYTKEL